MIPVLYRGSVKDILGPIRASDGDRLVFEFSDAYSVFDWGRMPDAIPHKGEALCVIAAHFFEILEKKGIRTHYLGVLERGGAPKRLGDCTNAPRQLMVKAASAARPQTEALAGAKSAGPKFVPLEVIFRFGFPAGSSAIGRIPGAQPGGRVTEPFVEFSTKLEDRDRLLSDREAGEVAKLSPGEVESLKTHCAKIARVIESEFQKIGIVVWDGKLEFARDSDWILVDSIGPDELRLSRDGAEFSKEVLRAHYRKTPWFASLNNAKKRGSADWRREVASPPALPSELLRNFSNLYANLASSLTGRKWWNA